MFGHDTFQGLFWFVRKQLGSALGAEDWPAWTAQPFSSAVHFATFSVFACLIALLGLVLRRPLAAEAAAWERRLAPFVRLFAAAGALGLLYAITRSPPHAFAGLIKRWDHLAMCTLAGAALHGLPRRARQWALAAISLYLLLLTGHDKALAIVLVTCAVSYGASRLRLSGGQQIALQVAVLGGVYLLAFALRPRDIGLALQFQGIYCWVWMRQVSFLVETRRGQPAGLADYVCYTIFYPPFYGAVEVYNEFAERNYGQVRRFDLRRVLGLLLLGQLYTTLSLSMRTTSSVVFDSASTPLLWWNLALLFLRSGLFVMGFWSTVEAVGLLYGIQLRPNYPGVIWCQNPAQFWRSWRATMTNWLIRYVYVPLGGNRHHQIRNIAAAFAVSTAWHLIGFPFLRLHVPPLIYVPTILWGALNASGVIGYVLWRRTGRRILPDGTPWLVRAAPKVVLTGLYGSFTLTLLGFDPDSIRSFAWFCRMLVGL